MALPKGITQIFPTGTVFRVFDPDAYCYLDPTLQDPIFMHKNIEISVIRYDETTWMYSFYCRPSDFSRCMLGPNPEQFTLYLPAHHLEAQLQTKLLKRIGGDKQCVSKKIDNNDRKLCRVCGGPVSTQVWFSNRLHGICLQCEPTKGK